MSCKNQYDVNYISIEKKQTVSYTIHFLFRNQKKILYNIYLNHRILCFIKKKYKNKR
jgi:hypothetical protein